jgi:hypothetical protein
MKKSSLFFFGLFSCLFVGFSALGADAGVVPSFAESVGALIGSITSKAPFAVVLVAVFQFLRTNEMIGILGKLAGKYLQVAIAALTALGFVAAAWARGESLGAAAIEGLFSAGGAMLIYDAIRNIPKSA